MRETIHRKITGSMTAGIEGEKDEIETPLFAINWFNTRFAFVYHFYNLLVAGRVFKVGGKLLFKGKCQQAISGNKDLARHYLLIVNYPSGHRFLDLLADRPFQLMSVFRTVSVKRFSFVLQKRLGVPQLLPGGKVGFDPNDHYAVLQIRFPKGDRQAAASSFDFDQLELLAEQHELQLFFAGRVAGTVFLKKNNSDKSDALPFLTDITVVIRTPARNKIPEFFASKGLEKLLSSCSDFFAAHVERSW